MKKILTVLCLLAVTGGVANAYPMKAVQNNNRPLPVQHKIVQAPKPVPVVYQVPVMPPNYSNNYNNSPYITFSLGNVDVTLGL